MKRLTIMILTVLLCGAAVLTSSRSITAEPKAEDPERTWDPSKAVLLSGGPIYCVEAWDVFKNGEFQKTTYLAGRI